MCACPSRVRIALAVCVVFTVLQWVAAARIHLSAKCEANVCDKDHNTGTGFAYGLYIAALLYSEFVMLFTVQLALWAWPALLYGILAVQLSSLLTHTSPALLATSESWEKLLQSVNQQKMKADALAVEPPVMRKAQSLLADPHRIGTVLTRVEEYLPSIRVSERMLPCLVSMYLC